MKKIYIAVLLFTILISKGQVAFEKGYFIDNMGIKTTGYIKNLDWRNNPNTFKYKISTGSSEELQGKISDYQEFGIDDNTRFVRRTVNIERSDNMDLNRLRTSKKPIFKL